MSTHWSKFFWSDYESDRGLKLCSMAAQGFWMRCLCIAAKANPTGYVTVNDLPLNGQDLALLTGASVPEAEGWLSELDRNGVFSRDRTGRIYSRRMVREAKTAATARKNGKMGGNPTLRKQKPIPDWDNPPLKGGLKPHKPESRVHTAVAAARAREGPAAAGADVVLEKTPPRERRKVAHEVREAALALHGRIVAALDAPEGWRNELGEVVAWLEQGYDAELDVMATVRRVTERERKRGRPAPLFLRYFREPLAECFARRGGVSLPPTGIKPPPPAIADDPGSEDWRRLRAGVAARIGADAEASWLAKCRLVAIEGGQAEIVAPSRFIARRLETEFGEALEDAARELGLDRIAVRAA